MRCRNFRRQSTQSEEMSKTRGRRDSCAQISDGTVATMTVETTAAFYDTSTQTGEVLPPGRPSSRIPSTFGRCVSNHPPVRLILTRRGAEQFA